MKKKHYQLITVFFPFIVVWSTWLLTAFCFNVREVFQHGAFWFVTGIYYVGFAWLPLYYLSENEV